MVPNQREFRDGEAVCHSEERSDEESGFLRLEEILGYPGPLAMIATCPNLGKRNLLPGRTIHAIYNCKQKLKAKIAAPQEPRFYLRYFSGISGQRFPG
jgi:hypothetical protein